MGTNYRKKNTKIEPESSYKVVYNDFHMFHHKNREDLSLKIKFKIKYTYFTEN